MSLRARGPAPPTAIVAANDEFASEVLHAQVQERIRVPDDMVLVGFDDIPVAARLGPPLATVAQPKEEQGRLATKVLIDLRDHPATRA